MDLWEEVCGLILDAQNSLGAPPPPLTELARIHGLDRAGLDARYSPHEEGAWAAARNYARNREWPPTEPMEKEILWWALSAASDFAHAVEFAIDMGLVDRPAKPIEPEELFERLVCARFDNEGWMKIVDTTETFLDGWLTPAPHDIVRKD